MRAKHVCIALLLLPIGCAGDEPNHDQVELACRLADNVDGGEMAGWTVFMTLEGPCPSPVQPRLVSIRADGQGVAVISLVCEFPPAGPSYF